MEQIVGKGGWFTTWICTKVEEIPFVGKREAVSLPSYRPGMTLSDVHGKEPVSPIKRQFVKKHRFLESPYPEKLAFERICSQESRVDCSGFWDYPTDITFYARLSIDSDKERNLPLSVVTCGAVKFWVNGTEVFAFAPYDRNTEQQKQFAVSLKEGRNELIVGCNDLAERNTLLRFALRNEGEAVRTSLPVTVDGEKLSVLQSFLDSISLQEQEGSLSFTSAKLPFDISLTLSDGSQSERLSLAQGTEAFSSGLVWGKHVVSAVVSFSSIVLRKLFYLFLEAKGVETAPDTEAERKRRYVDTVLEDGKPSVSLFIAGLSRGVNLYETCAKPVDHGVERVEKRADCSDFCLVEMLWEYVLGKDILSPSLLSRMHDAMVSYRYWFDEKGNDVMWFYSENHALAFHACEFIAGSLFPDETFSNSGMTGKEHKEKARGLLRSWFASLFAYGYNEWSSVNYIPLDMLGYITLLVLSGDEEMKDCARRALDMTFDLFSLQCYHGMLLGSNGRAYPNDLLSPTTIQANVYCYFAWGTPYMPGTYRTPLLYALSPYECSPSTRKKALWDDDVPLVEKRVQGSEGVQTVFVKTKSWFFGSSSSPLEGKPGSQEHLLDIMVGDGKGRIWINHPGEADVFGSKRPGYFNGNGLTPHVSQFLSSCAVFYRFSSSDQSSAEVGYTHLICRRDAFDEQILEGKELFLRRGTVNLYIRAENGLEVPSSPFLSSFELRSPGLWNSWYVRLDDSLSFSEFVKAMRHCDVVGKRDCLLVRDPVYGLVRYASK